MNKLYLIVIAAFLAISACGRVTPEEVAKMDPHPSRFERMQVNPEAIEGDWESLCNVEFAENGYFLKTYLSLHQGRVTLKRSVFRDPNCLANPIWERTLSGQYMVNLDYFTQQYFTMTVVSKNPVQTSILNLGSRKEDRYCKTEERFEINKPMSFSPISQCNEEMEKISKLDLRGVEEKGLELFYDDLRLVRSIPIQ